MNRKWAAIGILGVLLSAQAAQAGWTPAKRLTWTSGGSFSAAIAVGSSGLIHVVWRDDTSGNNEIYYKGSADGGTTWSAAQRLSWTSSVSDAPAIAVDSNGTIHVTWQDSTSGNVEIYYRKSSDGGTTWSAARRLTWTSGSSNRPAMATDSSNTIHLVWWDDTSGLEIYYKKGLGGGATWSSGQNLSLTSGLSYNPDITITSNDSIHVAWSDDTPGNDEIYYKKSQDGGTTWSALRRLTWNSDWSGEPAIDSYSSQNIHVIWLDNTPGPAKIYYKKSKNGGAAWSAARRLTWTSGGTYSPAISVDSSEGVHVVWRDDTPGDDEVFYMSSPDGGLSWGPAQRLTWSSGSSYDPELACDSGNTVHLVWSNDSTGNFEIYYKQSN